RPRACERRPMIVYGRNPVREALRGRRAAAVRDVWATPAAARERWLGALAPHIADASAIEHRCGSGAHQGVCAEAGDYPYASDQALVADPDADALLVVLDEVR